MRYKEVNRRNKKNTKEEIFEIKNRDSKKEKNLKLYFIRLVLVILLLETFYIIFGFSNQNGDESKGVSRKVSEKIIQITDKNNNKDDKDDKVLKVKKIEPIIRKLAHFSLYTIVGILLMSLVSTYNLSKKNKFIICMCLGCLYACSDEIHQTFVKGRSGQVLDVLIDTLGVFIGALIINYCFNLYRIKRKSPI